jgi:hypothetical protein
MFTVILIKHWKASLEALIHILTCYGLTNLVLVAWIEFHLHVKWEQWRKKKMYLLFSLGSNETFSAFFKRASYIKILQPLYKFPLDPPFAKNLNFTMDLS